MEYIVAIEETVNGEFRVEASSPEEAIQIAQEKYFEGEFVLEPGDVSYKQVCVIEPEEQATDWVGFY